MLVSVWIQSVTFRREQSLVQREPGTRIPNMRRDHTTEKLPIGKRPTMTKCAYKNHRRLLLIAEGLEDRAVVRFRQESYRVFVVGLLPSPSARKQARRLGARLFTFSLATS